MASEAIGSLRSTNPHPFSSVAGAGCHFASPDSTKTIETFRSVKFMDLHVAHTPETPRPYTCPALSKIDASVCSGEPGSESFRWPPLPNGHRAPYGGTRRTFPNKRTMKGMIGGRTYVTHGSESDEIFTNVPQYMYAVLSRKGILTEAEVKRKMNLHLRSSR